MIKVKKKSVVLLNMFKVGGFVVAERNREMDSDLIPRVRHSVDPHRQV